MILKYNKDKHIVERWYTCPFENRKYIIREYEKFTLDNLDFEIENGWIEEYEFNSTNFLNLLGVKKYRQFTNYKKQEMKNKYMKLVLLMKEEPKQLKVGDYNE